MIINFFKIVLMSVFLQILYIQSALSAGAPNTPEIGGGLFYINLDGYVTVKC